MEIARDDPFNAGTIDDDDDDDDDDILLGEVDDVQSTLNNCEWCHQSDGIKIVFCRNCNRNTWIHKRCAEIIADDSLRIQCTTSIDGCSAEYDIMYTGLDMSAIAARNMSATFARCIPERRRGRLRNCLISKPVLLSLASSLALAVLLAISSFYAEYRIPVEIDHSLALMLAMMAWLIYPREARSYITIYRTMAASRTQIVLEVGVTICNAIACSLALAILKELKDVDAIFAGWVGITCIGVMIPIDCFLLWSKRRIYKGLNNVPMRLLRADTALGNLDAP